MRIKNRGYSCGRLESLCHCHCCLRNRFSSASSVNLRELHKPLFEPFGRTKSVAKFPSHGFDQALLFYAKFIFSLLFYIFFPVYLIFTGTFIATRTLVSCVLKLLIGVLKFIKLIFVGLALFVYFVLSSCLTACKFVIQGLILYPIRRFFALAAFVFKGFSGSTKETELVEDDSQISPVSGGDAGQIVRSNGHIEADNGRLDEQKGDGAAYITSIESIAAGESSVKTSSANETPTSGAIIVSSEIKSLVSNDGFSRASPMSIATSYLNPLSHYLAEPSSIGATYTSSSTIPRPTSTIGTAECISTVSPTLAESEATEALLANKSESRGAMIQRFLDSRSNNVAVAGNEPLNLIQAPINPDEKEYDDDCFAPGPKINCKPILRNILKLNQEPLPHRQNPKFFNYFTRAYGQDETNSQVIKTDDENLRDDGLDDLAGLPIDDPPTPALNPSNITLDNTAALVASENEADVGTKREAEFNDHLLNNVTRSCGDFNSASVNISNVIRFHCETSTAGDDAITDAAKIKEVLQGTKNLTAAVLSRFTPDQFLHDVDPKSDESSSASIQHLPAVVDTATSNGNAANTSNNKLTGGSTGGGGDMISRSEPRINNKVADKEIYQLTQVQVDSDTDDDINVHSVTARTLKGLAATSSGGAISAKENYLAAATRPLPRVISRGTIHIQSNVQAEWNHLQAKRESIAAETKAKEKSVNGDVEMKKAKSRPSSQRNPIHKLIKQHARGKDSASPKSNTAKGSPQVSHKSKSKTTTPAKSTDAQSSLINRTTRRNLESQQLTYRRMRTRSQNSSRSSDLMMSMIGSRQFDQKPIFESIGGDKFPTTVDRKEKAAYGDERRSGSIKRDQTNQNQGHLTSNS